jgi:hypothetical protein
MQGNTRSGEITPNLRALRTSHRPTEPSAHATHRRAHSALPATAPRGTIPDDDASVTTNNEIERMALSSRTTEPNNRPIQNTKTKGTPMIRKDQL